MPSLDIGNSLLEIGHSPLITGLGREEYPMINKECPITKWGGKEGQVRAGMPSLDIGNSLLEIGRSPLLSGLGRGGFPATTAAGEL